MVKMYKRIIIILFAVIFNFFQIASMQKKSKLEQKKINAYIRFRYQQLASQLPDRKNWHHITINNLTNKNVNIIYYGPCPGFEGSYVIKKKKIILEPKHFANGVLIYRKYKILVLEENGEQKLAFGVNKTDFQINIKEQSNPIQITSNNLFFEKINKPDRQK